MDMKTIGIALVAIIAVAAIGFVVLDGGDSEEDEVPVNYDGRLKVFGNANNDDYINSEDLDCLREIIDSKIWDKSKNPYADANLDEAVDEADIEFVKKMLAGEKMRINYVDGYNEEKSISVPVNKTISVGYDANMAIQILNKHMNVIGKVNSDSVSLVDPLRDSTIYNNAENVSATPFKLDLGLLTNLKEKEGDIDAVIHGGKWLKSQEKMLNELGIDLVCMNFSHDLDSISGILTTGYILGSNDKAKEFVDFIDKLKMKINKEVESIPDDKRTTALVMIGSMIFSSEIDLGLSAEWIDWAGADSIVTKEMLSGAVKKKVAKGDFWHLDPSFRTDHIVEQISASYGDGVEKFASEWKKTQELTDWDKMNPDKYPGNITVLNTHINPWIGIAYLAEEFYPENFEDDFGNKMHQQFIDKFFPDLVKIDYKVADHCFFAHYEDLKDLL